MATETVTALPRVRVRKGRVMKRWWFVACQACPAQLFGARGSHAGAIKLAEQHLRERHDLSEPPC